MLKSPDGAWRKLKIKLLICAFALPGGKNLLRRLVRIRTRFRRAKRWQIIALKLTAVFCLAAAALISYVLSLQPDYVLTKQDVALIGQADKQLLKSGHFHFNRLSHSYYLNQQYFKTKGNLPTNQQVIGNSSSQSAYAVQVPQILTKGIRINDHRTGLSFRLSPVFKASPGKIISDHIVYPLSKGAEDVYTIKQNGLAEDLVLNKPINKLTLNYRLNLPPYLTARSLPGGAIGIYSAAPVLFGHISYGSQADRLAVAKAKLNSLRNYLVFALTPPVIKNRFGNNMGGSKATLALNGNVLTLSASNLNKLSYPVDIDPSIIVSSASSWGGGNNESNISINATSINEGGLTGGSYSGAWTTDTAEPLAQATENATTIVYNGYIYEIGGYSGTSAYSTVYYAPINSNGSLGAWVNDTTNPLPQATKSATSVEYNGYVYILGGSSGSANYSTVYYAPINSDGSLGAWVNDTASPLPQTIENATSVVYNGYIYEIGGYTTAALTTVYYAPVNADGSLGAWVNDTASPLPQATELSSSVEYNGYIYEIGGSSGSAEYSSVYYAPVNSDGSLGTWVNDSSAVLPQVIRSNGIAVANGYIYSYGGINGTTYISASYYAQINSDGSLGVWNTDSDSLPQGLENATSAIYNGYVYSLGGQASGPTYLTQVYYNSIAPAGAIGGWTTNANSLPSLDSQSTAVEYNGYIYVLGGYNDSSTLGTVYYAQINSNGSVGTWTNDTTNPLPQAVQNATSVVYNGYIYVLGGYNGSKVLSTVYYTQIGSGGAIGAWSSAVGQDILPQPTDFANSFVANGYIYEIGGINGSTRYSTVYYTQIGSGGANGSWTLDSAAALPQTISDASLVTYNNYVYLMGGYDTTDLATVYYASINSDGSLSAWVNDTASPLPSINNFEASVAYNGYIYILGGKAGTTYYNAVYFAPINSDGSIGAWQTNATVLPAKLYWVPSIAYNGNIYLLGGHNTVASIAVVRYCPIGNSGPGTINSWNNDTTNPLTQPLQQGQTLTYNGYIYQLGGTNGTTIQSSVYYAPLSSSGSVGAWTTDTANPLPQAIENFSASIYNGYVYVIGGSNGSTAQTTVYYAPIGANGAIGAWVTDTANPLTQATENATTVIYNGYIYEIGGYSGSSAYTSVYSAPIGANGAVGAWTAITGSPLPQAIYEGSGIVYNGYVYVIGGNNGSADQSTVYFAQIGSNGALGAWTSEYENLLPQTIANASIAADNGYLYIIGGNNGTSNLSTIYFAAISYDGYLGPWFNDVSEPLSQPLDEAGTATYNGYLYVLGGNNGSATQSTVYYGGLASMPRVGYYSLLIDMADNNQDVTPADLLTNGTNAGNPGIGSSGGYGGISVAYRFADQSCVTYNTVSYITFGLNSPLGTPYPINLSADGCGHSTELASYLWLRYTLDDSQTATFPDINGNQTTLSNLYVYYAAATASRLRGGAAFAGGSLQDLYAPPTAQ